MDLIIAFQFNLQVVHTTGSDNAVADALSRFHYNVVTSLAPHTSVSLFEPPWLSLGHDFSPPPVQVPSQNCLDTWKHKRALALGSAIKQSSTASYSSVLQTYLSFCCLHHFLINPMQDTLSFYIVWMSHYITLNQLTLTSQVLPTSLNLSTPLSTSIANTSSHQEIGETLVWPDSYDQNKSGWYHVIFPNI